MNEEPLDGKLENQLGDEDTGTLTPKTNLSANRRPDRNTNTSITTMRPSWYIWPGTSCGNHSSRRTRSRRKWWK